MSIGDFMAGAGNVGTGMRQAEQEAHLARMRQQAIQEENRRVADLREGRHAGVGLNPDAVQVPDFKAMAAGQPLPTGTSGPGKLTPEQLAEAKKNLPPEDYAILAYGQRPTAAPAPQAGVAMPGQQPVQPTAQPTTEQLPAAPTPQPQAGLAAPAPAPWQPAPRGPDGMAIVPDPREPRPGVQSTVDPQRGDRILAPGLRDLTLAKFNALSPEQQARRLQMENDFRATTRFAGEAVAGTGAALADAALTPFKAAGTALGNALNLPGLGRSLGMTDPDSGNFDAPGNPTANVDRVMDWGRTRNQLTDNEFRHELSLRDAAGKPAAEQKPAEEPKAEPAKEPPKGPAASALTATGGVGVKQQSAATAAPPENPSAFYAAHPESIAADRRRLDDTYQRMRDAAYKRAEIANRYGQTDKLQQMQQTVLMLDAQYEATARMLEGQHAVSMFEYSDDPRAMGMILSSQLDGTPVGFNRRDDGQWDLFIGENNYTGTYPKSDITSMVREFTDVNFRESMAATMTEVAMKNLENQLKIKFMLSEVEAQTLHSIVVESIRTNRALAVANVTVGAKEFSVGMTPDSELYIFDKTTQQVHFVDSKRGEFVDSPTGPIQVQPQTRGTSVP